MKLDFNDLLIVPKDISDINSRAQVNPFRWGELPLFTAPMDTVVSEDNQFLFSQNRIAVCTPRQTKSLTGFKSYSIKEMTELYDRNFDKTFDEFFSKRDVNGRYLIDVANGHMDSVLNITKKIKSTYPNVILMVGNIANPETYKLLSEAGADYIRVGIGNGGGCLTTQNTGIGYPMASLIKECYEISMGLKNPAYIVADGGMQSYSDVIKALALGADFVMLGSILNKCLESAGQNYLWKRIKVSPAIAEFAYKMKIPVYKKFRGMSTKEVQRKWNAKTIKTSEGVVRFRRVEYTLPQWSENFESYLRSAMSYAGCKTLEEFIGGPKMIRITDNAYKRFNK